LPQILLRVNGSSGRKVNFVIPSKAKVTVLKGDIIVWPLILNKSAKITVEMCLAVTARKIV